MTAGRLKQRMRSIVRIFKQKYKDAGRCSMLFIGMDEEQDRAGTARDVRDVPHEGALQV